MSVVHFVMVRLLRLGEVTSNTLLKALGTGHAWRCASTLFRQLVCRALDPDPLSFTAFSGACMEATKWMQTLGILGEARCTCVKLGLQRVTLVNIAINACGPSRLWELALGLFLDVNAASLQKSLVTHNTAANALAKGAQWQRGIQLLNCDLRTRPIRTIANEITFTAAITACEKAEVETQGTIAQSLIAQQK